MAELLISANDIEYFTSQNSSQLDMIIAGMTSLVSDTENKVQTMENQHWFQRITKTLFGKNKLTVQELRQNHEKLGTYSIQALSELYKKNKINQEIMISLCTKMNEIYASNIQLKQILGGFVNKLNEKIESVDNFHMLTTEIEQGLYNESEPIVSIFRILSQFDPQIVKDERKNDIIQRAMRAKNIIIEASKPIKDYVVDILNMPERYAGLVYLEANGAAENFMAQMASLAIESYNFIPAMNRTLLSKVKVADNVISAFPIDENAEISTDLIYSDLLRIKREQIENIVESTYSESMQISAAQINIAEEAPHETLDSKLPQSDNNYIDSAINENRETPEISSQSNPPAIEKYVIERELVINKDEKIKIENKDITFNADIVCAGALEFTNCKFTYDISYLKGRILLKDKESCINFEKCLFLNKVVSSIADKSLYEYFISDSSEGCKNIEFNYCTFINCLNFIQVSYGDIFFNNSLIQNPVSQFLSTDYEKSVLMLNCEIRFKDLNLLKDFNLQPNYFREIFNCGYNTQNFSIRNSKFISDGSKLEKGNIKLISGYSITKSEICNCEFVNLNCFEISNLTVIRNSYFYNCSSNSFSAFLSDMNLFGCLFVEFKGSLYSTNSSGKPFEVSTCKFINILQKLKLPDWGDIKRAVLEFYSEKEKRSNIVKNCIFNGIDLENSYLIAGGALEKITNVAVEIKSCKMENCMTNIENKYIFKVYDKYLVGLFNKKIQEQQVVSVTDCEYHVGAGRVEFDNDREIATGVVAGLENNIKECGLPQNIVELFDIDGSINKFLKLKSNEISSFTTSSDSAEILQSTASDALKIGDMVKIKNININNMSEDFNNTEFFVSTNEYIVRDIIDNAAYIANDKMIGSYKIHLFNLVRIEENNKNLNTLKVGDKIKIKNIINNVAENYYGVEFSTSIETEYFVTGVWGDRIDIRKSENDYAITVDISNFTLI